MSTDPEYYPKIGFGERAPPEGRSPGREPDEIYLHFSTSHAKVKSDIDHVAGSLIGSAWRIENATEEYARRVGVTSWVMKYRICVWILRRAATALVELIGDNNSVTYEKLLKSFQTAVQNNENNTTDGTADQP